MGGLIQVTFKACFFVVIFFLIEQLKNVKGRRVITVKGFIIILNRRSIRKLNNNEDYYN